MNQMPIVEVYIILLGKEPTGAGETSAPVITLAITNVLAPQAAAQRLTSLPLKLSA